MRDRKNGSSLKQSNRSRLQRKHAAFAVIPKRVFKHNNKQSISLFFLFSKIAIHIKQWWQMKERIRCAAVS